MRHREALGTEKREAEQSAEKRLDATGVRKSMLQGLKPRLIWKHLRHDSSRALLQSLGVPECFRNL